MDYKEPNAMWVGALIFAILLVIVAKAMPPEWELIKTIFYGIAGVLGIYGGIELLNYALYHLAGTVSDGLYNINMAKVAHTLALAGAIKDLSNRQLELISSGQVAAIKIIAGDTGPAYFVRGVRYDIPYFIVDEFLDKTGEDGFLFPIRDSRYEGYVTDFTNSLVAKGWADPAVGNKPARLTKDLRWVRQQFGME